MGSTDAVTVQACKIAKLFAKHFKVTEQEELLRQVGRGSQARQVSRPGRRTRQLRRLEWERESQAQIMGLESRASRMERPEEPLVALASGQAQAMAPACGVGPAVFSG